MGELFTNVQEYLPLIRDRLIDFIRVHMSDIGGLTVRLPPTFFHFLPLFGLPLSPTFSHFLAFCRGDRSFSLGQPRSARFPCVSSLICADVLLTDARLFAQPMIKLAALCEFFGVRVGPFFSPLFL